MALTEKQIEPLQVAVVFEKDEFREPLLAALQAAGITDALEYRISKLDVQTLATIRAQVMLVNLEPILNAKSDLLMALVSGSFGGEVIFNDADATQKLEGNARARWARHISAKILGGNVLPPMPAHAPASALGGEGGAAELWILAASIGGPEAVRGFLSALDEGIPYAFVLAQHIGGEFLDLMVSQLNQISNIPVREACEGDELCPGTVLVVPVDSRFAIDKARRVHIKPQGKPGPYSPCIDQVMHDCASGFGQPVNAIIFSGMASDGVKGAAHLLETGGEVWVQDPETCVVSSIVDGALKTGKVEVMGTPAELAARLNARAASGAAATA